MKRAHKRLLRNGLGVIALFFLISELLALWSFLSSLAHRAGSVTFSLIFVTFTASDLVAPVALLVGSAFVAAAAISYLRDYTAIRSAVETIFREAGAMFGLLPPAEVVVRAAVRHDGVRWIGDYEDDGRVVVRRQECPYCAIELETAHLPQIAAQGEQYGQQAEPLDGDVRLAGSQLSSIFRYHTEADVETENLIEARACPQCSFAVPGSEIGTEGREDVHNIINSHIGEMEMGADEPFSQWRHRARERVGGTPSPGDLWDEYALESSKGEVQFVNVIDTPEITERVTHGTYPALEQLKEDAQGMNRLIASAWEPLDVIIAKVSQSSYIDDRRALLKDRQAVRNELLERLTELEKQVGPQIDHALHATDKRQYPDDPEGLENAVTFARTELDTLHTQLPDKFLTKGEQRRLSRLRNRLSETEDYLAAVHDYEEAHELLSIEIEVFDESYAPYEQQTRYMTTADRAFLQEKAAAIHDGIRAFLRERQPSELPREAEQWLLSNRDRFGRLRETIPTYNQGSDERQGFVDSQIEQHEDVFESEHGELNRKQKLAVVRNDERNIVDASAGTGKTLTLTTRYEYLYHRGVSASDILVLTLTTEATSKLTEEIVGNVGGIQDERQVEVYNFHQFADDIVDGAIADSLPDRWKSREKAVRADYVQGFCDGSDEIRERHPDAYERFQTHAEQYCEVAERAEFPAGKLSAFLEEARNFDKTAEDIVAELTRGKLQQYHFGHAAAVVLEAYRDWARESEVPIDQLDRLDSATSILNEYPEAFEDRYEHILVDEFQDVAEPSVRLIEALLDANEETRLFVVGDDWQSIYGFRGSNPSFFRNFEARFDSVTRTTLETNYRCPPAVVDASRELIVDGTHTDKPVSAHSDSPETPQLYRIDGFYETMQTHQVVETVQDALDRGMAPEDILILSRNYKGNPFIASVVNQLREEGLAVSKSSDRDGVTVQPIHSSKGKDEKCVILVHFTDDKDDGLPSEDRVNERIEPAKTSSVSTYLEEKRLAYVALTRTQKELHVCTKHGQESPFLDDIDHHFDTQVVSPPDTYSGTVTEFSVKEKRCEGVLDCDNLHGTLSFVVLRWEVGDETFDDVVSSLEEGARYRFEHTKDVSANGFDDDIEITASTTVERLDNPETQSNSASAPQD